MAEATFGRALTAKQQTTLEIRRAGGTNKTVAQSLGISETAACKLFTRATKKVGRLGDTGPLYEPAKGPKEKDGMMPLVNIAQSGGDVRGEIEALGREMRKQGMRESAREAMVKRWRVKYCKETLPTKNLLAKDLSELIGNKIFLGFQFLDEKSFADASARDLMLGLSALIEKKQLLDGLPTQIISDLERKKLVELMPLFLAEAQRRGVTIPGTVVEKTVEPA